MDDDTGLFEIISSSGAASAPTRVVGAATNDQTAVIMLNGTVYLFFGSSPPTGSSSMDHTIYGMSRPVDGIRGPVEDLGVPVFDGISAVVYGGSIPMADQGADNLIDIYSFSTNTTTPVSRISCWYTPHTRSTTRGW